MFCTTNFFHLMVYLRESLLSTIEDSGLFFYVSIVFITWNIFHNFLRQYIDRHLDDFKIFWKQYFLEDSIETLEFKTYYIVIIIALINLSSNTNITRHDVFALLHSLMLLHIVVYTEWRLSNIQKVICLSLFHKWDNLGSERSICQDCSQLALKELGFHHLCCSYKLCASVGGSVISLFTFHSSVSFFFFWYLFLRCLSLLS